MKKNIRSVLGRHPILCGLYALAASITLSFFIIVAAEARAGGNDDAIETTVQIMTVPADKKLINASWSCERHRDKCELWILMRSRRTGERAESYVFSRGPESYVITELSPEPEWETGPPSR